jgi:hypothetical protein
MTTEAPGPHHIFDPRSPARCVVCESSDGARCAPRFAGGVAIFDTNRWGGPRTRVMLPGERDFTER